MLNRVILIGRLTRQPELRITPGGTSVTTITLAVDRRPSPSGQKETDFIDVVLFGRLADVTCQYMDKGRLVAIEGRLQSRSWETKDGQKRKSWEVIADSIQFLDGKPKSQDQTANSEEEYSEEDSTFTE